MNIHLLGRYEILSTAGFNGFHFCYFPNDFSFAIFRNLHYKYGWLCCINKTNCNLLGRNLPFYRPVNSLLSLDNTLARFPLTLVSVRIEIYQ